MNAKQEEEYRQHRVRQSAGIIADDDLYKACGVCSSISRRGAAVCPICHAYQWDESAQTVIETVQRAATSVFPFTLGYAPPTKRVYHLPAFTD